MGHVFLTRSTDLTGKSEDGQAAPVQGARAALWLTLVVPGAARADARGRVRAWFLVVGPAGLLITVIFTAVSGQTWTWPWVLAAEPAMVIGCAGLLVLIGA